MILNYLIHWIKTFIPKRKSMPKQIHVKYDFKRKIKQIDDSEYKDVNTPGNWNNYWNKRNEKYICSFDCFPISDARFVEEFQRLPIKSILIVGNGISQYPRWFEYAGFECTALDISDIATEIAENFDFKEKYLIVNYIECKGKEQINQQWKVPYRSGGKATFIAGDIRDDTVCNNEYDLIICDRVLHLYCINNTELHKMVNSLVKRLKYNGKLIIGVMNFYEDKKMIERVINEKGVKSVWWFSKYSENKEVVIMFGSG